VWNLTATEYYDWIGVVDAETDDTVAKVSINTLVSWTNPVGAHSWSEVMTTVAKVLHPPPTICALMPTHTQHTHNRTHTRIQHTHNRTRTIAT
jgi:hypothetical protein